MEEFQGQEFLVIIMSTVGWSAVTATRPIGLFSHHNGFFPFGQFASFDSSRIDGRSEVSGFSNVAWKPIWISSPVLDFLIGCLETVDILVLKNVFSCYV